MLNISASLKHFRLPNSAEKVEELQRASLIHMGGAFFRKP